MSYASYEATLLQLAEKDPSIVVLTAENRAAIRNLPQQLGARFIDVGICEQTMIGAAAGLALRGRRPVAHALASFLTLRAFEFIRSDVGIANLSVTLVGGVAGFLSDGNGPTHQAIEDVALMRGIPGMRVICPADELELTWALRAVLSSPGPAYIRHIALKPGVEHRGPYALGKAEVLSEGGDVSILTCGLLLREAEKARVLLEEQGVSVRLVNLRSLQPLDEHAVLRALRETRIAVTLEDHFLVGGLASIVAELLMKHHLVARVHPFALEGRWFTPALLDDVLRTEGFTGAQLAARILKLL